MRKSQFPPLVVGLSLVVPTFLGVSIFWFADQNPEESFAADVGIVDTPGIPASHQAILKALHKTRKLNYKHQSVEACFRDLSETLGIKIHLHESTKKFIHAPRGISVETKELVSHLTAIRLILKPFGLGDCGIVFDDNKLTIVRGEDYQGLSLRTYSLMGRADFSIAKRQRWMESTRTEIHPDTWTAGNQTWIQPGESIFEIDVYQHQKVHNEIAKRMSHHHALFSIDKDVQALIPNFLKQDKSNRDQDKKAAVERLRKKYAFESMSDRLKYESVLKRDEIPTLSPQTQKRIRLANEQFEQTKNSKYAYSQLRSRSLQMLHESEVEAFINRAGMGRARMPSPGPSYLKEAQPPHLPLASNEMIRTSDDVPVNLPATKAVASTRQVTLPSQEALVAFHQNGESAFLSPQNFGYVKNRNQVAGFQSHGFTFAPQLHAHMARPWYRKEKEVWAIYRLELVSLLKHEKPAVYVSRNLPRMDKLQTAQTRPLNAFEQSALRQLDEGEDVVTKGALNRIKMIGSLRATKQCQQCHEVKNGALLGAFSYELLRDPQLDPDKHRNKPVF